MLKIWVKDFGPIIEGSVSLRPLTIFVGPSNAGKSYLAMLVYSRMQSLEAFSSTPYGGFSGRDHFMPRRLTRRRVVPDLDELEISEEVRKAISDWVQKLKTSPRETLEISFGDLPEQVRRLVDGGVKRYLQSTEQLFSRELQRCHGDISDIRSRRTGGTHLQIGLEQSQPLLRLNFEEEKDSLRTLPSEEWDISQQKFKTPGSLVSSLQAETSRQDKVSRRNRRSRETLEMQYIDFLDLLIEHALTALFEGFPRSCYYLPAARSGIAQGHKAIASILVRQSSFAAISPLEIPTLSGIITDFMGHILTMEQAGGRHHRSGMNKMGEVVDFMEREVVRGKVDIERSGEVTYPEISYAPITAQPIVGKFPFHKTSSMVSELAPVILFLKYLVRPEDLVILEEPESHLHPASQRQMARGIARLVKAGVKVIITTHSDYFIGQINNLLKLSHASKEKRTKRGYASTDCLKSDDVGAYHFLLDDNLGGSLVKELPIIPDFGIDEQELAAVSEALYEETISLQRVRAK